MNAYNPISSMKRLEDAGLDRRHAVAIAAEISSGTDELVTKIYLKDQLNAGSDRLLVRIGLMVSGIVALACTVMGVILPAT